MLVGRLRQYPILQCPFLLSNPFQAQRRGNGRYTRKTDAALMYLHIKRLDRRLYRMQLFRDEWYANK